MREDQSFAAVDFETIMKENCKDYKGLMRIIKLFEDSTSILFYHHENDTLFTWMISKNQIHSGYSKVTSEELLTFQNLLINQLPETLSTRSAHYKKSKKKSLRGGESTNLNPENSLNYFEVQTKLSSILFPETIKNGMLQSKYLLVAPCNNIGTIPLYLLNPYDEGKLLIDNWTYSIVHSLSDIIRYSNYFMDKLKTFYPPNTVFLGASKFDHDFYSPLPGVLEEINAVNAISSRKTQEVRDQLQLKQPSSRNKILMNEAINAANFSKSFDLHSENGMVYIATHGQSSVHNPLDSNIIIFSDNSTFSSKQVQKLYLEGTSMVVLSACQTGQGKSMNGGTISIGRSFLKAGVQNVVFSLWNVSDEATVNLMSKFANEIYTINTSSFKKEYVDHSVCYTFKTYFYPALQLRNAILLMRAEDPNPRHWAPFISMGVPAGNTYYRIE
jgi:hypothetical protein